MNEQILWSALTAIVVAFFTTVILQYVFAPALEARKQIRVERSRAATAVVDTLRLMRFELDGPRSELIEFRDLFSPVPSGPSFGELCDELEATSSLRGSGLPHEYVELTIRTRQAARDFDAAYSVTAEAQKWLINLIKFTTKALDPAVLPWIRVYYCRRGISWHKSMATDGSAWRIAVGKPGDRVG